jgi:uncharacterized DUF497 family protein
MDFEWDPRKAKANRDKHGVEFEVARNVFHDPARVINLDDRSGDEERWQTIGLASGRVLFVVYSERDNECHPHHLGAESEAARRARIP